MPRRNGHSRWSGPVPFVLGMGVALPALFAGWLGLGRPSPAVAAPVAAAVVAGTLWLLGIGVRRMVRVEDRPAADLEPRVAELEREMARRELDAASQAGVIERARRLTESSFVAGSEALVRVRGALRALQDWRQRLEDGAQRPQDGHSELPPSIPVAGVLDSLLAEVRRLTDCVQRLRSLADAGEVVGGGAAGPEAVAGEAVAGAGARAPGPAAPLPSPPSPPVRPGERGRPSGVPLVSSLIVRGLVAELEHGLLGLGAELRVLRRARLTVPALDGERSGGRRSGSDSAAARTLERLEAQMGEVAEHVAALTRGAEHLSRELDRLRLPHGSREPAD